MARVKRSTLIVPAPYISPDTMEWAEFSARLFYGTVNSSLQRTTVPFPGVESILRLQPIMAAR